MLANVHQRVVPGTPAEVWNVLVDLGALYPAASGTLELPEGVHPGAPVHHDGTRYLVQTVEEPHRLWFDVPHMGGGHGFELIAVDEHHTLVRHSTLGRPSWVFLLLWVLYVRWAHNRASEGILANLDQAMRRIRNEAMRPDGTAATAGS